MILFRCSFNRAAILAALLTMLPGCASMLGQGLAGNLSQAIVNQSDPEIVRTGAPAYLLLIDGMIEGNPEDEELLLAGARLNVAYAAVFIEDEERARHMGEKARNYANRALCQAEEETCGMAQRPYEAFAQTLRELDEDELDYLYTTAMAWALWIQQRSGDWGAVAELPKVEAMLERVVAIDEAYQAGQPHLYLGILRSLLPPAMGGKPERGRYHFERAIALSQGRNLMAKVEYARRYARLMFDRELHDRLCREVIKADPVVPGLTLSNVLAQKEAQTLLTGSAEYFME